MIRTAHADAAQIIPHGGSSPENDPKGIRKACKTEEAVLLLMIVTYKFCLPGIYRPPLYFLYLLKLHQIPAHGRSQLRILCDLPAQNILIIHGMKTASGTHRS